VSATAPALPRPARTPRRGGMPSPRMRLLVRGRAADPWWIRPALVAILVATVALFLWDLTISGWSNTYYAAAARAGSESWKAWFFGALDPGSFITVDKPPLSLWLMGLSARVLGYSSFSILLPQALCMAGAVGLLYAAVRRGFGAVAGLIAASALALTPITVAMARVDMPDALLVLLLVASAAVLMRAIESGRTRTLVWVGVLVGLAFMTKMLQGWMVVPALAAAYLLAGPPRLLVRAGQLCAAGVAMVAVSAAWPVAVSLWPAASRPYIGGSEDGSVWNLILGYNGFGRIVGEAGPGGGASFGGAAGLWRMFNEQVGAQVAWLLPLAGVSLLAGLWLTRCAPRTDRARAAWVLFGVWAVVHVVVFSSQQGIFHPYYVSALAPAVAALAGGGLVMLWRWARVSWLGVAALDLAIASTALLAVILLARTPDFMPALRTAIPALAFFAIAGSVVVRVPALAGRRLAAVVGVAAALAITAGPASYSVATIGRALDSNNVLAGPASAAQGFGGPGGSGGARLSAPPAGASAPTASNSSSSRPAFGGGPGGASVSTSLVRWLEAHQGSAKYLVAANGSMTTAPIIISSGKAVVTIGGFNGSDPAPTVGELASMVARGELKYVLLSGDGGGPGGGGSQELAAWVQAHGTAVTGVDTGGATLYRVSA
jgi:4-amino-4-deoxy-L-arabinose transferase-like glycosyltransferase